MFTPPWLVSILALYLMIDKIDKFKNKKPTNYLYLSKAVVDAYFVLVYIWIQIELIYHTQLAHLQLMSEAANLGIALLFVINAITVTIERFDIYVTKKAIEKALKREGGK